MAILDLKELRKEYRKGDKKVEALRGVNLVVEKGEFLSIVGRWEAARQTF